MSNQIEREAEAYSGLAKTKLHSAGEIFAVKSYDDFTAGWTTALAKDESVRKLVEALEEIADQDFRGNRPWSASVAFEALAEFKKAKVRE